MTPHRYATPAAFKKAVEQRLKTAVGSEALARRRQRLVFERFLARVSAELGAAVVVKGGVVLELRLERARATRDVDLRIAGDPDTVLARLQSAARRALGDFMTFEVIPNAAHPEITNDGMIYKGLRFRAECRLDGKIYAAPFGVDVAFGDPMLGEPDTVTGDDVLMFAGIEPPTVRVYPVETHVAEKVHAYTMPRARPNSRVKDLPDIVLLATVRELSAARIRAALAQTFGHRRVQDVPAELPAPPASWSLAYEAMARQDHLPWRTLADVTTAARAFLDPVLGGAADAMWDPASWRWIPR